MMDPDPMTADELRALDARLERVRPCAFPGCAEQVEARLGVRGRQPRFCSGACRAKFSRERIRLHALLRRLDDTSYLVEPPASTDHIDRLMDLVKWLLEPYGGVDTFELHQGFSPRPFRTLEESMEHFQRMIAAQDHELDGTPDAPPPAPLEDLPPESRAETRARWAAFSSHRP